MQVVTFGGDDAAALALIRSGNIESYFSDSPDLSTALPIAYALCNLADNSTAKVGETTSYELKECTQIGSYYYTDWNQWKAAFIAIKDSCDNKFLATNSTNIAKSNEISVPPGTNANLGPLLTFAGANTSFDFDFYLKYLGKACSYPLVFNDNEFAATDMISIGDVDQCQVDNFEIGVSGFQNDCYIFAIGIILGDNSRANDERLEVFYNDSKLKEVPYTSIPHCVGAESFMGIVSSIPITKIKFTEGYDGDDIYIKDFSFGVGYRQ
jgi:hypothetical protein